MSNVPYSPKTFFVGTGGLTFAKVVKSVDEIVSNSTTLQDDDELMFSATDNKNYSMMMILLIQTTAVADFKYTFTIPTGTEVEGRNLGNTSSNNVDTLDLTNTSNLNSSANVAQIFIIATVRVGSTSGDVVFQWAQRTAEVSNTTVFKGSSLIVWEND